MHFCFEDFERQMRKSEFEPNGIAPFIGQTRGPSNPSFAAAISSYHPDSTIEASKEGGKVTTLSVALEPHFTSPETASL
jgi:hypothetical protein